MALATLKNTTEKLQVVLGGAVSATECPITASFADYRKDAIAGGNEASPVYGDDTAITTGGTAVDVVDPPPSGIRRVITGLSFYNDDTASVTVTVRKYVDASTTRVIFYGTLLTNESVHYSDSAGWRCLNANGEIKHSAASDTTASSSQASSMAALVPASVSSQASSTAALVPASVSSQASSVAALVPHTVSSQASSMVALVPASVSSQASLAAVHSSIYSLVSVQSFTDSSWSTASSAVSRLKTSFTW